MDVSNLFADTSLFFAIFLMASIAGMFSERSGVVNIGIEGYMIIGALVYAIMGSYLSKVSNYTQLLALLTAAVVCGLFSILQSVSSIYLKADQIISGTAINMLAQGIGLFLVFSGKFGAGTYIDSGYREIAIDSHGILSLNLIIAIIIAGVVGVYFTFTKIGKWHIAAGENPNALDAVGISVIKFRWSAAAISGAIAGLAGCFFITYIGIGFSGTTNGFGFIALAIMIIGQWRTSYITVASFAFSLFFAFSKDLPYGTGDNFKWFKDNMLLVQAMPFLISLLVMIGASKWSSPPKFSGLPFDKARR